MIPKIIRERTLKGIFAREGSSGTRARRYNPVYARRAGKNAGGPVDLFRSGQLHSAIKGRGRIGKRTISATGFVSGSNAKRKFQYHQIDGSGRSRIKRRFIYLTKAEGTKVVKAMIRAATTK